MIYLHLPTFYTHCPLNMAKCWKTWRHPPVLQCGNCSNAPFKIDFIWFPNDLKLRFFFWFRHFPAAFDDTNRQDVIHPAPGVDAGPANASQLDRWGNAPLLRCPWLSHRPANSQRRRSETTWKNVERFSVKPRAIPKIWAKYENLWVNMVPSGYVTVCHGKSPFLIGKPSISMGHGFHGYVK